MVKFSGKRSAGNYVRKLPSVGYLPHFNEVLTLLFMRVIKEKVLSQFPQWSL